MESLGKFLTKLPKGIGDFAFGGELQLGSPALVVQGGDDSVFHIRVSELDKAFKELSDPHCKGSRQTRVGSDSPTWIQLEPDQFECKNLKFQNMIDKHLEEVKERFGIAEDHVISANITKLVLLGPGSTYKPTDDSQIGETMFSKLLIQLPSAFKGGHCVFKSKGLTETRNKRTFVGSDDNSDNSTSYCAFYPDCDNEWMRVTSGHQILLVYSLHWLGNLDKKSSASTFEETAQKLANLLSAVEGQSEYHVWDFDEEYTKDSFCNGFHSLRKYDRVVASALLGANEYLESEKKVDLSFAAMRYDKCDIGRMGLLRFKNLGCGKHDVEYLECFSTEGTSFYMNPNIDFERQVVNKENSREFWGISLSSESEKLGLVNLAHRSKLYKKCAMIICPVQSLMESLGPGVKLVCLMKKLNQNKISNSEGGRSVRLLISSLSKSDEAFEEKFCEEDMKHLVKVLINLKDVSLIKEFIEGGLIVKGSSPQYFKELFVLINSAEQVNMHSCLVTLLKNCPVEELGSYARFVTELKRQRVCLDERLLGSGNIILSRFTNHVKEIYYTTVFKQIKELLFLLGLFSQFEEVIKHTKLETDFDIFDIISHLSENAEKNIFLVNDHFKRLVAIGVGLLNKNLRERYVPLIDDEPDYEDRLSDWVSSSSASTPQECEIILKIKIILDLFSWYVNGELFISFSSGLISAKTSANVLHLSIQYLEKAGHLYDIKWLSLLQARIDYLKRVVQSGEPSFSWCQPEATLKDYPKIEKFLRGPKKTYVYKTLRSKDTAWELRNKIILPADDDDYESDRWNDYCILQSLRVDVVERENKFEVKIIKTRAWFDRTVKKYQEALTELPRLEPYLTKMSQYGAAGVPTAKRQRPSSSSNTTPAMQSEDPEHKTGNRKRIKLEK